MAANGSMRAFVYQGLENDSARLMTQISSTHQVFVWRPSQVPHMNALAKAFVLSTSFAQVRQAMSEGPQDIQALTRMLQQASLAHVSLPQSTGEMPSALPQAAFRHGWPGKAREMENMAERKAIACRGSEHAVKVDEIPQLPDNWLEEPRTAQANTLRRYLPGVRGNASLLVLLNQTVIRTRSRELPD